MWQIVQLAASIAISILMRPRKPDIPSDPHDLNGLPVADPSQAIPVVFGKVRISKVNVVWWGDLAKKRIKKKGGKGK